MGPFTTVRRSVDEGQESGLPDRITYSQAARPLDQTSLWASWTRRINQYTPPHPTPSRSPVCTYIREALVLLMEVLILRPGIQLSHRCPPDRRGPITALAGVVQALLALERTNCGVARCCCGSAGRSRCSRSCRRRPPHQKMKMIGLSRARRLKSTLLGLHWKIRSMGESVSVGLRSQ